MLGERKEKKVGSGLTNKVVAQGYENDSIPRSWGKESRVGSLSGGMIW